MEHAGILVKTPKGVDEIRTRAHRLAQNHRLLLILVDGSASVEDMVERFPSIGNIRQTLQDLVDEGYVDFKEGTAGPAARAAGAADASGFSEAAGVLSRNLHDLIGPTADDFTRKLEGAHDRKEFLQAARSCVEMAESFAGRNKAELFWQRAMAVADRYFPE